MPSAIKEKGALRLPEKNPLSRAFLGRVHQTQTELQEENNNKKKPGSLYIQGLKISKNLVAAPWGQPCVI